jgi:hypothetical protein
LYVPSSCPEIMLLDNLDPRLNSNCVSPAARRSDLAHRGRAPAMRIGLWPWYWPSLGHGGIRGRSQEPTKIFNALAAGACLLRDAGCLKSLLFGSSGCRTNHSLISPILLLARALISAAQSSRSRSRD